MRLHVRERVRMQVRACVRVCGHVQLGKQYNNHVCGGEREGLLAGSQHIAPRVRQWALCILAADPGRCAA
jgi:hypothetical protein